MYIKLYLLCTSFTEYEWWNVFEKFNTNRASNNENINKVHDLPGHPSYVVLEQIEALGADISTRYVRRKHEHNTNMTETLIVAHKHHQALIFSPLHHGSLVVGLSGSGSGY